MSRAPFFIMNYRILVMPFALVAALQISAAQHPGLTDAMKSLMGGTEANPVIVHERPAEPHTSFHTQTGYLPEYDIRTDAVIVYDTKKEKYESWKAHGYDTQTMYCFRADEEYISKHRGEGQTDAKGDIFKVGAGQCYYMVPTQARLDLAIAYFDKAIDHGSTAVVPEEPEFFAEAGYSDSFKKEWQEYYHEPWRDPASSIEARWKSDRLKADMEHRLIDGILQAAKAKDPAVKRMLAIHSPLHYYSYGLIYPYHQTFRDSVLQELIAQVWTGTARAPTRLEGVTAERTFEWGYLEYSSLYQLMRDSGKRLWFFMDPLEDNLDRGIEDYQENYEKTLIASLLFPAVDEYEVMPWPTRIYGNVPDWFTTKMGTIVNMLGDMHKQKGHTDYAGTPGIATFVADSMGWQRAKPHPSDMTGFHGMTLPLVSKGIPVQVAQLERSVEPDYLSAYKVLLLSYDLLKPMSPAIHDALAGWVREGGTLIVFGGADPYNDLDEWWKKAGFASPQDHLFAQLGVTVSEPKSIIRKISTEKAMKVADNALTTKFPQIDIPKRNALTTYQTDARALYTFGEPSRSLIFEQSVDQGHVIFVGVAPRYFSTSKKSAALLRALVAYGCEHAGVEYRETGYLGIRRGKYVALQSLGQPFPLKGSFINVVGREVKLVNDPVIPVGGRGMFADVTAEMQSDIPRILISSDRIEGRLELADATSFFVTGPLKTKGVARLSTAGRNVASVTALDASEQPRKVFHRLDGDTIFVRYDSLPEGVMVKVEWR